MTSAPSSGAVSYTHLDVYKRQLLDGADSVKLFGEDVAVRAKIVNFPGLSSHADHDHLVDWIKHFTPCGTWKR